jgi:predicted amidohydrolase
VGIIGSFLANTAAQLYNRAFFIEPNGDETYYDKRHLFSFGGEDKVFNHGLTKAPIVRFRGFNIKLVVCYDLRFPVFCRNVKNNYDLLVVIANWPKSREKVWRTLLAARAMENECYVCGVNRCGTDPAGVEYPEGSSLVIDFKGKVIAQRMNSPVITADLSPALLAQFREKFPAWRDADDFTLNI